MSYKIDVSKNIDELSEKVAKILQRGAETTNNYFTVALSGGSTPKFIFQYLAKNHKNKIYWNKIKFFWGDERCVPADHPESNYLMAKENLFDKINIPSENIFAVNGSSEPKDEAKRYSEIINFNVVSKNGFPQFDLVLLGLGEDGHTASIFPDQLDLLNTDKICETAIHPTTKQIRITITGKVINNAAQIVFLVTGKNKKEMADTIINKKCGFEKFPTSHIYPASGSLIWMLDDEAAN